MKDWLKDKYKDILLNGLLTLLIMLLLSWKTGLLESREKRDAIISGKADKTYVDDQDAKIIKAVDRTEDLFLNEIRELRKDLRLKKDKE